MCPLGAPNVWDPCSEHLIALQRRPMRHTGKRSAKNFQFDMAFPFAPRCETLFSASVQAVSAIVPRVLMLLSG